MHFVSMTNTLTGLTYGDHTFDDIEAPDATFHFNCAAAHLNRDDNRAPYELTWATKEPDAHKFDYVAEGDVTPELWATWVRFKKAIDTAHADGRVSYRDARENDALDALDAYDAAWAV